VTLELTHSEYSNLQCALRISDNRMNRHPYKTSAERESMILNLVMQNKPNAEIKNELHTSDEIINRVKRKNGLWGV